jgi:transposase
MGIGEVTISILMAQLTELAHLSNKQISALVGVAPFCKDSGTMKDRRVVWGGRTSIRSVLYMSTHYVPFAITSLLGLFIKVW